MPSEDSFDDRVVERLAKKNYDDSKSGTLPWLRLGWGTRVIWMDQARASIAAYRSPFAWLYFWRSSGASAIRATSKDNKYVKGTTTFESRSEEAEKGRPAQGQRGQGFALYRTARAAGPKETRPTKT
ncbi:MAG TPA: hypothetical protein VGG27_02725 [Magnetospirillaceae bacterium]